MYTWTSLMAQIVKNMPANAGDLGSIKTIPGLRRFPWRKECLTTPIFLPVKFHGQRSLVGYSPWGHKESDMTEQLKLSLSNMCTYICIHTLYYAVNTTQT